MSQEKGTEAEVLQHASARTLDTSEQKAARNQILRFHLQTRSSTVLFTDCGIGIVPPKDKKSKES